MSTTLAHLENVFEESFKSGNRNRTPKPFFWLVMYIMCLTMFFLLFFLSFFPSFFFRNNDTTDDGIYHGWKTRLGAALIWIHLLILGKGKRFSDVFLG